MIFANFFRNRQTSFVLKISKKMSLLCERLDAKTWRVSYFLIGPYGNFLIGKPLSWKTFDKFMESKGGTHWVLPFEVSSDQDDDLSLFRRYGCRWLVDEQDQDFDHVPAAYPFIKGIKLQKRNKKADRYDWGFEFDDVLFKSVVDENPSALRTNMKSRALLAPVVRGSMRDISKIYELIGSEA